MFTVQLSALCTLHVRVCLYRVGVSTRLSLCVRLHVCYGPCAHTHTQILGMCALSVPMYSAVGTRVPPVFVWVL